MKEIAFGNLMQSKAHFIIFLDKCHPTYGVEAIYFHRTRMISRTSPSYVHSIATFRLCIPPDLRHIRSSEHLDLLIALLHPPSMEKVDEKHRRGSERDIRAVSWKKGFHIGNWR